MPDRARLLNFESPVDPQVLTQQERNIVEFSRLSERFERSLSASMAEYAARVGLTLQEGLSLQSIHDLGDRAKVGVIADKVRIPLSTMTGIAHRLETDGLVIRQRAADDGRAFVLRLTDDGRSRLEGMFIPFLDDVQNLLRNETADALTHILEVFRKMAEFGEQLEANAIASRPPSL